MVITETNSERDARHAADRAATYARIIERNARIAALAPTYPECHWCAGTHRPISEPGSEAVGEDICEACAATLDCDAFDS